MKGLSTDRLTTDRQTDEVRALMCLLEGGRIKRHHLNVWLSSAVCFICNYLTFNCKTISQVTQVYCSRSDLLSAL